MDRGGPPLKVTFYGVRGSCPCSSEAVRRYGGNTACVALEVPGEDPIIFDLGTGLRQFGATRPKDATFSGTALVTHIHWDHVQGLPFFPPIHKVGAKLDIYGPHQQEGPLGEVVGGLMCRPYFPVHFSELQGDVVFHDVTDEDVKIGRAKVKVRPVPHNGPTVGYRVDWDGVSVAYISDHQAPHDLDTVAESALELADGVDLLIHDAQYTPAEFAMKETWGHCTIDYAVLVAKQAGARKLALFHHDPEHSDEDLDRLLEMAKCTGLHAGVDVVSAYEYLSIDLGV